MYWEGSKLERCEVCWFSSSVPAKVVDHFDVFLPKIVLIKLLLMRCSMLDDVMVTAKNHFDMYAWLSLRVAPWL